MKLIILTIVYLSVPINLIFAGAGHEEITVLSEADWISPIVAVLIIALAIIIAKKIRTKN